MKLKLIKIGVLLKLIGRMQGSVGAMRDFLGEHGSIGVGYPERIPILGDKLTELKDNN